jgi:hypothetical protein
MVDSLVDLEFRVGLEVFANSRLRIVVGTLLSKHTSTSRLFAALALTCSMISAALLAA